jgi:protein-disulfide isomerase
VDISDYGCSHCRNYHTETEPLLEQRYLENGDVYYIALPYALSATTAPAANAGLCAAEQDRYFEFSAAMFANYNEPDNLQRSGFLRAGAEAGLDAEAFTGCMDQARYNNILQANLSAAQEAGVSSTPNFFINGEHIEGAVPFAIFQQKIDALLGS